jgi:hypothetical protein
MEDTSNLKEGNEMSIWIDPLRKRIAKLEAENKALVYDLGGVVQMNANLEAEREEASQDYADLLKDFRALRKAAQARLDMSDYCTAEEEIRIRANLKAALAGETAGEAGNE